MYTFKAAMIMSNPQSDVHTNND